MLACACFVFGHESESESDSLTTVAGRGAEMEVAKAGVKREYQQGVVNILIPYGQLRIWWSSFDSSLYYLATF